MGCPRQAGIENAMVISVEKQANKQTRKADLHVRNREICLYALLLGHQKFKDVLQYFQSIQTWIIRFFLVNNGFCLDG